MGDNFFLLSDNYKNQIDIWFRAYNISHEKLDLFRDFLKSLYELVEDTYLGEDVMIEEKHQKEHFTWCWNKTVRNFEKEKINFYIDEYVFVYFWNFFYEAFYLPKLDNVKIKIPEYFNILFDFNHVKTRSEIDVLTEIYKLLNEALKNR